MRRLKASAGPERRPVRSAACVKSVPPENVSPSVKRRERGIAAAASRESFFQDSIPPSCRNCLVVADADVDSPRGEDRCRPGINGEKQPRDGSRGILRRGDGGVQVMPGGPGKAGFHLGRLSQEEAGPRPGCGTSVQPRPPARCHPGGRGPCPWSSRGTRPGKGRFPAAGSTPPRRRAYPQPTVDDELGSLPREVPDDDPRAEDQRVEQRLRHVSLVADPEQRRTARRSKRHRVNDKTGGIGTERRQAETDLLEPAGLVAPRSRLPGGAPGRGERSAEV